MILVIKKVIIVFLLIFFLMWPVCASHDIIIDEKKVIANGDNITFVIGQKVSKTSDSTSWEEYPVSIGDYEKLQIGDKITVDGYNETSKLFSVRLKEKGCIL